MKRSEAEFGEAKRSEAGFDEARHSEADSPALPVLLLGNKADLLGDKPASPPLTLSSVALSALRAADRPEDLEPVRRWLVDTVLTDLADPEATPIVVNERHRQHFAAALASVRRARAALDAGQSGDALALDLGCLMMVGLGAYPAPAPHTRPVHDPVATLFHAARASDVILTVVGGRVIYAGEQVLTLDEAEVRVAIDRCAERMRDMR